MGKQADEGDTRLHPASLLRELTCTPSRRSTRFSAGPNARHFFFFDPTVSRRDRQFLFSCLFCFRSELIDNVAGRGVLAGTYKPALYMPEVLVEVRVVCDPLHPAFGQAGLYARRTIPNNTIVCPYAGYVEIFTTSCNSRTYTMGFGSSSDDYALDAEFAGNYGRFANDPRGVEGLSANVSAENRMNARGEYFTAMVSRRQISEGEEILMAYGKAHSLSASPWTDVQGNPLMRVRRGGELPFPHLATSGTKYDETSAPAHVLGTPLNATTLTTTNTSTSSPPAFELYWECAQCGMWTQGASRPLDLPRCMNCATPKLSGAALVAALSHPAVAPADLARAIAKPVSHRTSTDGADDEEDEEETDTRAQNQTMSRSRASPSSSSGQFPAVARRTDLAHSPSSSSSPTEKSTHSPASPQSPNAHHTQSHHHGSAYRSVRIDWPLNMPFIPWQVWDPSVPLTTVMKLSKFDCHEHIFLFQVTYCIDADDEDADEDGSVSANAGSGHDADDDDEEETRDASTNGRSCPTQGGARRLTPSAGTRQSPVARRSATQPSKRPRTTTADVPDVPDDAESVPRTTRARRVSTAERMAKAVVIEDEAPRAFATVPYGGTVKMEKNASDDTTSTTTAAAAAAAVTMANEQKLAGSASQRDDTRAMPGAVLASLLQRPREVNRLICVPAWSTLVHAAQQHMPPRGGRRTGEAPQEWCPPSPALYAREALRTMSRRVLSAKSFEAGELVANLGGAVRCRDDPRCRPDWSPLAIPLQYLLPTAWRRQVLHGEAAEDETNSCEGHEDALSSRVSDDQSAASHRRTPVPHEEDDQKAVELEVSSAAMAKAGRGAFLSRMAGLTLIVTNEMMYCPCLIAPLDEDIDDALHVSSSTRDAASTLFSSEAHYQQARQRYEEDRRAVLAECNVALVLSMDMLGSPFVAAIATRRIEAFEPLLARTQ